MEHHSMTAKPADARSQAGHQFRAFFDAPIAMILAILALVPSVANGSLTAWPGNNDNMLRLVQIRDLLAGQSWFDYSQYRMGPDGGFIMHWSRIVDLPNAAIILAVEDLTGSQPAGEMVAGIVWPTLPSGIVGIRDHPRSPCTGRCRGRFPGGSDRNIEPFLDWNLCSGRI